MVDELCRWRLTGDRSRTFHETKLQRNPNSMQCHQSCWLFNSRLITKTFGCGQNTRIFLEICVNGERMKRRKRKHRMRNFFVKTKKKVKRFESKEGKKWLRANAPKKESAIQTLVWVVLMLCASTMLTYSVALSMWASEFGHRGFPHFETNRIVNGGNPSNVLSESASTVESTDFEQVTCENELSNVEKIRCTFWWECANWKNDEEFMIACAMSACKSQRTRWRWWRKWISEWYFAPVNYWLTNNIQLTG